MSFYEELDYKQAIRGRVQELKKTKPGFSLRKIAASVPMQYTFLSRVLNRDDSHLSEDQLYSICKSLELYPNEADYLFLLRSYAITGDHKRRQELHARIESERRKHTTRAVLQDSDRSEFNLGMTYLLEPEHLFTQLALHIDQYRKTPKRICNLLGVSVKRLEEILTNLNRLGHIRAGSSAFDIQEVSAKAIHFGPSHPLVRVHQSLLRTQSAARLQNTPEEDKKCLQVLFNADQRAFEEVKTEFDKFIKRVEKIVAGSNADSIYHLNFDFFRWLR